MYYMFCIRPAICSRALYAALICIYCGTDLMLDADDDDVKFLIFFLFWNAHRRNILFSVSENCVVWSFLSFLWPFEQFDKILIGKLLFRKLCLANLCIWLGGYFLIVLLLVVGSLSWWLLELVLVRGLQNIKVLRFLLT